MLKLFDNVKAGIDKPSAVPNAVITNRIAKLSISSRKHINHDEAFFVSVQHLQADPCEGRFLLSGRSDGSILLHQIKNTSPSLIYQCKRLWKCDKHERGGHKYSVECVRWFPNDTGIFISAGFDKRLKIWDTSTMKCVETISYDGKIYSFDLSPARRSDNCSVAVCCEKGIVSVFDLQSGTNVHTLKHHVGDVFSCNWSPLDEHVLCTGGADNKVLLWDTRSAKNCLMSLNRSNSVQITLSNPCVNNFTAHSGAVNAVKFVKDGLKLISCGTDNVIRLWDTLSGKNELVDYDDFSNSTKRSIHIDISRDTSPEFLYVPSGDAVNVYSLDSGKLINKLKGHFSNVNCCFYESFQCELYSGCTDGLIIVWCDDGAEETAYGFPC